MGGALVTLAVMAFPAVSALVGGCNEATGIPGEEDKSGVNDVPSPGEGNTMGPGSGGFGEGGGSTGTGAPCTKDADCQDSDLCTLETCGAELKCVQVGAADDHNACTTDTCDPDTGEVANTPVQVNDNNPCTFDECNPATGAKNLTLIPIFSESFNDNVQGWALGPQWQIGSAAATTNAKDGGNDPSSDFSANGDGVAGTALGGLVAETMDPEGSFLTSPGIDVSMITDAEFITVRFYRWLNSDAPPEMTSFVEVLQCPVATPSTYVRLWENTGEVIDAPSGDVAVAGGTGWFPVRYDVTAQARACRDAGEPIRVRFGFQKGTAMPSIGGWNIDDFTLNRALVQADADICTDDVCINSGGSPTYDHPQLNIDDGEDATTFACDPGTGPSQNPN